MFEYVMEMKHQNLTIKAVSFSTVEFSLRRLVCLQSGCLRILKLKV